jgi:uncharacterized protein YaiL (DUF2058 family)
MFLTLPLLPRAISFTGSSAGGRRKRIPRKHTFDYDPAKDCYVERQSAAEVARDALREKARLAQLAKEERAKKASQIFVNPTTASVEMVFSSTPFVK